jgi:hypothetical protein
VRLAAIRERYRPSERQRQAWQAWRDDLGILSADSWRYLAMAKGEGAPKPYHYRWLLPRLLGEDRRRWATVSTASVAGMVPAMWWLTGNPASGAFAFTLYGVWDMARRQPVLTDAPAMLAAIVAAAATKHRRWELAVAASLVAGATRETAPVFAAVYAWHPLPLIGLVSPLVREFQPEGPDITDDFSHTCVTEPTAAAYQVRAGSLHDWKLYAATLGGLLAGGRGDVRTAAVLVAAYAQLAVAVDTSRLIVWAWPVLADNVARTQWWPAALAVSAWNPYRVSA